MSNAGIVSPGQPSLPLAGSGSRLKPRSSHQRGQHGRDQQQQKSANCALGGTDGNDPEHAAAGHVEQGARQAWDAVAHGCGRHRGKSTIRCGFSVSRRLQRFMSNNSPRTRSSPTWPNSTGRPTATSAPTASSARNASRRPTSRSMKSNSGRKTACIRFPIWRCRRTASRGRRSARFPALRSAARAFSPMAHAASRKSTAPRSASRERRAFCLRSRPSISIAACRRAASPKAGPRICAATKAKATSLRKSGAALFWLQALPSRVRPAAAGARQGDERHAGALVERRL